MMMAYASGNGNVNVNGNGNVNNNASDIKYWDDDDRNVRIAHNPWRRDSVYVKPQEGAEESLPLLQVCKAIVKDAMDARKMLFDEANPDDDSVSVESSSWSSSGFLERNYCAKSSSLSIPSFECISDDYDNPLEMNDGCEGEKEGDPNPTVDCTVHVTPFFYT
jgi:hypothetical protein